MVKLTRNFVLAISLGLFFVGLIFSNTNTLVVSVFLISLHNFLFSFEDYKKRSIFLVFNAAFFVFLIGRLFVTWTFDYRVSGNNPLDLAFSDVNIINHILISLFISLVFLYLGYVILNKYGNKKRNIFLSINNLKYWDYFKSFSKFFFYVTIVFQFIYLFDIIAFIDKYSYFDYYLSYTPSIPSVFVTIARMHDVAFFSYLAMNPKKREVAIPIILYLLVGVVLLKTGKRSILMLNSLIIFIYFCYRDLSKDEEEKWISRKGIIAIIIAMPALLVLLTTIGYVRGRGGSAPSSIFEHLLKFFHGQGVSANVIGYTKVFQDKLPTGKFYSIGPVIEFVKNKLVDHLILGKALYTGQTVERALNGNLFSHAITYLIMPDLYLQGSGYGSSFIAEFYVDLGYIGVAFGSFMYGMLIEKLGQWLKSNYITRIFTLIIIRSLFFTPRAGALSFLVSAFTPSKILAIMIIIQGSYFIQTDIKREKEGLNRIIS